MRTFALALALAIPVTGCGGDKTSAPASAEASAKTEVEALVGPLTGKRILAAKELVSPGDDWTAGLAKLERFLGKPTLVNGNEHGWGVAEGDDCFYFTVDKEDRAKFESGKTGFVVGATMTPMRVEKDGPIMNRAHCMKLAGKNNLPPEDPNAPGPPTDGSVVPLATLVPAAIKARSKWEKQRVKTSALLFSVSTWKSNDSPVENVNLSLVSAKDKTDSSVGCALKQGAAKPDQTQFTPLVAEATVHVSEWVNGRGESSLQVSLEDCTVTFEAPPASPSAGASAAPSAGR